MASFSTFASHSLGSYFEKLLFFDKDKKNKNDKTIMKLWNLFCTKAVNYCFTYIMQSQNEIKLLSLQLVKKIIIIIMIIIIVLQQTFLG